MRLAVDAVLGLAVGGIRWRMLPGDLQPCTPPSGSGAAMAPGAGGTTRPGCAFVIESGGTSIQRLAVSLARRARRAIHRQVCAAAMAAIAMIRPMLRRLVPN